MRSALTCLLWGALVCPTAGAEPALARSPFSAADAKTHPRAWAEHLGVPAEWTNSVGMTFRLIPPGQFLMGSPPGEPGRRADENQHLVTITQAFYLATTEVTQRQWKAVLGKNPSFFTDDALPVETVSWADAVDFCRKLSDKEGVAYRLPTEAEWEYACRAGTTTAFYTGDTISTDQANYDGNFTYASGKKGEFRETTTDAGRFPPNAWGLYDLHGNVWEWCADWYAAYPPGEVRDPIGPATGEKRIVRGGCWINYPAVCRSANRGHTVPVSWNFNFGFRVARVLERKQERPPSSAP